MINTNRAYKLMNQHFTIDNKYKKVQSLGVLGTSGKAFDELLSEAF